MVECQNYGDHITDRFHRVLGNNDGEVAYKWENDDPGVEPDYDEVTEAAHDAA